MTGNPFKNCSKYNTLEIYLKIVEVFFRLYCLLNLISNHSLYSTQYRKGMTVRLTRAVATPGVAKWEVIRSASVFRSSRATRRTRSATCPVTRVSPRPAGPTRSVPFSATALPNVPACPATSRVLTLSAAVWRNATRASRARAASTPSVIRTDNLPASVPSPSSATLTNSVLVSTCPFHKPIPFRKTLL